MGRFFRTYGKFYPTTVSLRQVERQGLCHKADVTMSEFPKDKIVVVEKQIDRLRKEVDDRLSSNHTLWRAGLAAIGAFILFKETVDLPRFILLLVILCMSLAAHWLNQTLTLYRSGDAIAACEQRVNQMAGEVLIEHEIILTRVRRNMLSKRRPLMLMAALVATCVYWFSIWHVQPYASATQALLLWQVGVIAAALANIVAAVNLGRFLSIVWPSLQGSKAPFPPSSKNVARE